MFRMLGYADKANLLWDLTEPTPPGYHGPFSMVRPAHAQSVGVGPGRFGLPSQPLAYTTIYWDDNVSEADKDQMQVDRKPLLRMNYAKVLPTRPEAEVFPEMAVPGSGVMSKFRDSGYTVVPGLDTPL